MAKINDGTIHHFTTGEVVDADNAPTGGSLNPIFELFRVALNDTDQRIDQLNASNLPSEAIVGIIGTNVHTQMLDLWNKITLVSSELQGTGITIDNLNSASLPSPAIVGLAGTSIYEQLVALMTNIGILLTADASLQAQFDDLYTDEIKSKPITGLTGSTLLLQLTDLWTKTQALVSGGGGSVKSDHLDATDFGVTTTGDCTIAMNAAISASILQKKELYIPAGEYTISNSLVANLVDRIMIRGASGGATKIKTSTNIFSAFAFTGNNTSGNQNTGYLKDISILGASVRPTNKVPAVQLDTMPQFTLDNVIVDNYDIAFDFKTTCGNSRMVNCSTKTGVNVGINLRVFADSLNDMIFIDNVIYGEVAAVHISGGKGYQFIGGTYYSNMYSGTIPNDLRAVFILGKDYVTGSTGIIARLLLQGITMSNYPYCWGIRSFEEVSNLVLTGITSMPASSSALPSIGFLKSSSAGNTDIVAINNKLYVNITNTQAVVISGDSTGFSLSELGGTYTFTIATVTTTYPTLLVQSQITKGQASYRDGSKSITQIGGLLIRENGAALQVSSNWGSVWTDIVDKAYGGLLTALNTTVKTSYVAAINEVLAAVTSGSTPTAITLESPDGTQWSLSIDNTGHVTTVAL